MTSPPFTIRKPSDRLGSLSCLFFGNLGTGKTWLAATASQFPEIFGRVLLLAVDPGDLTLVGALEDNLDVADIQEFEDFNSIYEYLSDPDTNEYGTVIIDGLTDAAELSMIAVMQETVRKNPDRDPDLPAIDQWGKSSNRIRKLVRYFRDLPMITIFTALEKEVRDESSGIIYIRPSLPGKLANEVGAYCDIVGRLAAVHTDDGITRVLQVQPSTRVLAKDRTRRLGESIQNPSMGEILRLMHENTENLAPIPAAEPRIKMKRMK